MIKEGSKIMTEKQEKALQIDGLIFSLADYISNVFYASFISHIDDKEANAKAIKNRNFSLRRVYDALNKLGYNENDISEMYYHNSYFTDKMAYTLPFIDNIKSMCIEKVKDKEKFNKEWCFYDDLLGIKRDLLEGLRHDMTLEQINEIIEGQKEKLKEVMG